MMKTIQILYEECDAVRDDLVLIFTNGYDSKGLRVVKGLDAHNLLNEIREAGEGTNES